MREASREFSTGSAFRIDVMTSVTVTIGLSGDRGCRREKDPTTVSIPETAGTRLTGPHHNARWAVSKEWSPETVFDVLASDEARKILAVASVESVSAKELADVLAASEPTIYRRLDVLQEYDFVRAEQQIDDRGHHYKTYSTSLHRIEMTIEEGTFNIDIKIEQDLIDQFEEFWTDLERGAPATKTTDDPLGDGSDPD